MLLIRRIARALAFNALYLLADAMSGTGWTLMTWAGRVRELAGKVG